LKNADVCYPESEDDIQQPVEHHPIASRNNSRSKRNISADNSAAKIKESLPKSPKVLFKGRNGRIASKKRSECSRKSANEVMKRSISDRSHTATRNKSNIISQYSASSARDQSGMNAKSKIADIAMVKDTTFNKSESADKIDMKDNQKVNSSALSSFEQFKVQSSSVRKEKYTFCDNQI
jgi:hypothetical protein